LLSIIVQLLIDGLLMGCIYSLNAVGLSLIFGVVGLINFAYSDFMMIAMYSCFWLYILVGLDPLFSLPIAMILCMVLGFITYKFIIKRVLKAPTLAQTLSTFALGIILKNLAVFFFKQDYRLINDPIVSGQTYISNLALSNAKVFAAVLSIVATVALMLFLNKTKTGLALRATAINKQAASLMGINADRMYLMAYILGSACVGIAGAALSNFYYVYPYIATTFSTITFATIALGGFGSLEGALIAGLIIGVVESFAGFFIDSSLKYAVVFAIYFLVIVIRPKGLKGW